MRVVRLLFALILMVCLTGAAHAADGDKRIALVIGIGGYQYAPALPNPQNDARAIGASLRKLNFEVEEVFDLDNRAFAGRLRDFGVRAATADVAVVFYAGHGLQVRGQNYLLPSDARLERERDLVYEAMPLNLILGELSQARKLGVLILDACRNNPFADRLSRSNAGALRERDVSAGLARIDDTPSDTLVALATRADALAEDGSTSHSPYTDALLKNFEVPGLELGLFFRRVRDNVMEATQGRQEPFIFGSLGATPFYFNPAPPNRNPEIPALKAISVADNAEAGVKLGIGKITDPDGDEVFAQITGLPRAGQVRVGDRIVLIGDYLNVAQLSQVTFKPDPGGIGAVGSFDFSVMENRGGHATGSIPITVTQSNRPPLIAGERTLRVAISQLGLEPPTDPDGDPLTITVASLPSMGKVRKGAQPLRMGEKLAATDLAALTYDPEQSVPGNAGSFSVLIDDGHGGKATAMVRIEVASPDSALTGPDLEDSMWQRVRTSGQQADYAAYLQLFPNGRNAPLARERVTAQSTLPQSVTPQIGTAPVATARQEPKKPEASRTEIAKAEPVKPEPKKPEPAKAEPPKPEPAKPEPPKPEPSKPEAVSPPPQTVTAAEPPAPSSPATRNKLPNSFQDCTDCPIMVRVPPGTFTMGVTRGDPSEQPSHKVTLTKPFALGMYEVTVAEWRACIQGGGCTDMPRMSSSVTDATPIHNVHWNDAVGYATWLSRRTGQRYRLPTEAEWEYAARAGTGGRFWWGEAVGVANADCQNCGGSYQRTLPLPVGSYKPNPLGFYDMNGGVAEWVADCWNNNYKGAPADGGAWQQGDCRKRVLRGGSWRNDADSLSVTARLNYDVDVRYLANGFRIARDLN